MNTYEETKATLKKKGFYIRTRKQENFAFLYCNWTLVKKQEMIKKMKILTKEIVRANRIHPIKNGDDNRKILKLFPEPF